NFAALEEPVTAQEHAGLVERVLSGARCMPVPTRADPHFVLDRASRSRRWVETSWVSKKGHLSVGHSAAMCGLSLMPPSCAPAAVWGKRVILLAFCLAVL